MKIQKGNLPNWVKCLVINDKGIIVHNGRLARFEEVNIRECDGIELVEGEYVDIDETMVIPNANWDIDDGFGKIYVKLEDNKLKFKLVEKNSVYYFKQVVTLIEDHDISIEYGEDMDIFRNHMEYNDQGTCPNDKTSLTFKKLFKDISVSVDNSKEIKLRGFQFNREVDHIHIELHEGDYFFDTCIMSYNENQNVYGELFLTLHNGKIRCALDSDNGFRYLKDHIMNIY